MKPSIAFHNIASVQLTPPRHFPETGSCKEFWERELILKDTAGERWAIPLYSYVGAAALEPEQDTKG